MIMRCINIGRSLIAILAVLIQLGCQAKESSSALNNGALGDTNKVKSMSYQVQKTEEEWKNALGDEAFRVLRLKGTERPFTSEYETLWEAGTYVCKGCGQELFSSETKFDAGCGWP
ncbi:MAG: hypothetical protein RIS28_115, partial [Bacteroidota bacterium]